LADNRIGFDYGITNWLMTGIGRSSFNNVVDYFLKARITRQQTQPQNLLQHFSINWYSNVMLDGRPNPLGSWTEDIDQRFSYAHQLIIAKRLTIALVYK